MAGISYTQRNLIKRVLKDWTNRKLVQLPYGKDQIVQEPSEMLWQNWIKRIEAGTMSDSKQQQILKSLGYTIDRERTWVKN